MTEPAAETPDDGPGERPPTTGTALWVISDGTAGMRLQAIGLAEAMTRQRPELVISS